MSDVTSRPSNRLFSHLSDTVSPPHKRIFFSNQYIVSTAALCSEMLPASAVSDNQQITSQIIAFPAVRSQAFGRNGSPSLCRVLLCFFLNNEKNKIKPFGETPHHSFTKHITAPPRPAPRDRPFFFFQTRCT